MLSQGLFVPLADVDSVHQNRSSVNVIEAAERGNDRSLSATRGAHQRDLLTRPNMKGDSFEHRLPWIIGKPNVFELHLSPEPLDALGPLRILNGLLGVEQGEDSLGG